MLSISFKSAFFLLHVGDIKETKFKGKTKHLDFKYGKKGKDKAVVFFLPEFYILFKSGFFGALAALDSVFI